MIEMDQDILTRWNQIRDFELDDPDASLAFSSRLARENGWRLDYSLKAITEYKKFMFLITLADHPLTPSDQVDQVWHLHLIYTESYWEDFCDVLGRKIHHGPTKGGLEEGEKFSDYYKQTLEVYRRIFESEPPSDIWPAQELRFSDTAFRRVNISRNWIIPKLWNR